MSELENALRLYLEGDSSGLEAYERTYPGIDVGPETQGYRWAADQVLAFAMLIGQGTRYGTPTELMLLAKQITAGPTANERGMHVAFRSQGEMHEMWKKGGANVVIAARAGVSRGSTSKGGV